VLPFFGMSANEPNYPLVLVHWRDSHASAGWRELEAFHEPDDTIFCESVGWLIHDGAVSKVIAPHLSRDTRQGNGLMTIPGASVVSIRYLDPETTRRRARSPKKG